MSESAQWQLGLVLGVVVIAVAAVIVIAIVLQARKIAAQAKTSVDAVGVVREQTDALAGIGRDQRLRRADPARRPCPAQGGGGQVSIPLAAISGHGYWWIALAIGLAAALVVTYLLAVLISTVMSIERSVDGLLEVATKVAGNTANIPQLAATAPVLGLIVEEAVVQDGYMNALTDGFGGK